MKTRILFTTILMIAMSTQLFGQRNETSYYGNYINNRQPLLQKEYIKLPVGAIKPEGWMMEQFLRM